MPEIPTPDFLIAGYPRSGTTLLSEALNKKCNVLIPPETQFFRLFLRDRRIKQITDVNELINTYCDYPRIRDLNLTVNDFIPFIEMIRLNRKNLLGISLKILADKYDKQYMGEKSPANILYADDILSFYKQTRIIFLVRDGRDCVYSNMKQEWTHSNHIQHAIEWCLYVDCFEKAKKKYPDRVMLIRYEELVNDYDSTLKTILRFIGIPEQSNTDSREKIVSSVPDWELAWKKDSSGNIVKDRVSSWKSKRNDKILPQISYIQQRLLKRLGYEFADLSFIDNALIGLRLSLYDNCIYRKLLFRNSQKMIAAQF